MHYRLLAERLGRAGRLAAPLDSFEPEREISVDDYLPHIGQERVDLLKKLAEPLEGVRWAHLNSTFEGGGVAEMLRSIIPLARALGIDADWYAIRGNEEFFNVTKKFHNTLQGMDQTVSIEEVFLDYLKTIDHNAQNTFVHGDVVVVHDPQPLALVNEGVIYGDILWRCHIDTSQPNKVVWRFLLPYINMTAGAIFTLPEFVGQGLNIPLYQVMPGIDPLAEKNRQLSEEEAYEAVGPLLDRLDIDRDRPILASVSRYDPHKNQKTILEAFQRLMEERDYDKPPYLIFLGNTATDDPEGGVVLEDLVQRAGNDPNVHVVVENNNSYVGGLLRIAKGFIHASTREGFGLVVTEALWQGTPVIGARVGGIVKQVLDFQTGYLVNPHDAEEIALKMARILDEPDTSTMLGEEGKEHVRENFLITEVMLNHLRLLRYYTGVDDDPPDFRLNSLTYSELLLSMKRSSVLVQKEDEMLQSDSEDNGHGE